MQLTKKNTDIDKTKIDRLSKSLSISSLLAELLIARNIDSIEECKKYLFGKITDFDSPYIFPQMQSVVEKIYQYINGRKKILIYGDYDCDGVGAVSILYLATKTHGITVEHYIPTRATEGYGLSKTALKYISENVSPDLIITVDCGINSIEEINYAHSLGIDVIITDHHQPGDILPDCLILNPCLVPECTPYCGAGIVFTLVRALFGDRCALQYLDICSLSTVADIVPLVNDNRLIVKFGLEAIRKGRCRQGIKDLAYVSKADYKRLSTSDISFKIAPRINAAGRLSSAELSFKLLTSDDPTEIHLLSTDLALLNTERQTMNSDIFNEALYQLRTYDFSKYKLIMLKGDWNEGVVGIVCAKLTEFFNLPTILVCTQEGTNELKGSARSIPGINLYELFDNNNQLLKSYGGHAMAAGICFEDRFFQQILDCFNNYILCKTDNAVFVKKTYYDAELSVNDISATIISEINLMEPFGQMNPAPIFYDSTGKAKFNQIGKSSHIKAKYKAGELIAFDRLKYIDIMSKNGFSFTYHFDKNYFNGVSTTQFVINELKINTHTFNNNDLLENFCKLFISTQISPTNTCNKNYSNPTLYVAYDARNLNTVYASHPDINVCIYGQLGCELTDTLVVAPDDTFPFFYYSQIVFLEKTNPNLEIVFSKTANCIFSEKKISITKQTPDDLRSLYSLLKKEFERPHYFTSASGLYNDLYRENVRTDIGKHKFIIGIYIFLELGLLTISENGIMSINNQKVSLSQSELYNYVNE